MSQKRMRFQWFQDVPRNVTRREYQRFRWLSFCSVGLGSVAVMMAIAAITGLTLKPARDLEGIPALAVEEALAFQGDRLDLVKLVGVLVAEDPLTMPDDPARQVIRGQITLVARADDDTDTTADELPLQTTLLDWEAAAQSVFLSDGERQIPLTFNVATLPLRAEDPPEEEPEVIRQGESARTNRPVAIAYADEVYPLPLETWGPVDSVFMDFERRLLPQGQSVVVVAGLVATPQGNQLVDPLGDRLQVRLGTEAEIRQQGEQMRLVFGVLAIPAGIASFFIGRSAHRLRQEFIERSHQ
jgi:hypothetical protein